MGYGKMRRIWMKSSVWIGLCPWRAEFVRSDRIDDFSEFFPKISSRCFTNTCVSGGTQRFIQTLPPITVSPPRIVALAGRITASSVFGWRCEEWSEKRENSNVQRIGDSSALERQKQN
jgi:hypothetical protein